MIDGDGLIGTVTRVAGISAVVTLINDPQSGESALDNISGETGTIVPTIGNPSQLLMKFVAHPSKVKVGDLIVTAGARATNHASLFPANLTIGQVTSVPTPTDPTGAIIVAPAADLPSLENVQVLTQVPGG